MADPSASAAELLTAEPPTNDERWMAQALALAQQGVGLTSPNPTVGCVVVRQDKLVGAGFHQYDKLDHAEIVALKQAGELAQGATAYVTLEPCTHYGRTGPCANALIAAGITRAVVATADANPTVHGKGIERMRQAGIEVTLGVLQSQAQRLNDAFAKYIRTGLPFVTLKAAMSLDGRIAPPASKRKPGEIYWITGPKSRAHVHQLRHSVDAILTGIGTVLADDPLLTDRSQLARRRPLLRVVLDSQLRLPLASNLVSTANEDLLVFTTNPSPEQARLLTAAGVAIKQVDSDPVTKTPSLTAILQELGARQITSVMIEAGSKINSAFLHAGLVDRLFFFYAPRFLGAAAQPPLGSVTPSSPAIKAFALHRFAQDFAFEAWFGDDWQHPETDPGAAAEHDDLESTRLADKWGAGTFASVAASLNYHFARHGAEVGAANLLQFLRKADQFALTLERSNRILLPGGSVRYTKSGRYVIKSADGKILSFGLVTS